MKLPFCEMFFLFYLHPTNRFNVAKFHAQMSTKLKKQRHWFNAHSLKSFKTLLGPFRLNSQEVVRAPSPIFLKFYSNCHYPVWWTSAIFERYLWRNGMNIKLFSWGDVNYSYLAMFKALLLPNYIISGILVTLPNIEKITLSILWLPKVKGHGPPKLTVSSFCYKFSKIFKPCHGFISWQFSLIFGRIVADTNYLSSKNFIIKILLQNIKRFVRYLGSNLAWNEKTSKVGYLWRLSSPVMGKPFDLTNLLIFCNKIF